MHHIARISVVLTRRCVCKEGVRLLVGMFREPTVKHSLAATDEEFYVPNTSFSASKCDGTYSTALTVTVAGTNPAWISSPSGS